ncbi:1-aminocyclopropane-1-carboxylate synthase-like [Ipomoea triloba]|uniref:1-aminocyclopropane-1-carboxylate synthase-like n=1 Tax=Ipomoea triloba TaxID=35885 RepID=UPI00125E427A|nr:1-aminocyclopropane-1-carboxylate synthase-like [Ipomoea triloba]
MEFNSSNETQMLSRMATGDGHGENSAYFEGWKAYEDNPFDLSKNRRGVIQMGLAENRLCFDLIEEWVVKNPKASICTPQGSEDFKEIAIFQDYHGLPEFRNAVAKFMGKVRGERVTFDPDRIVMSGGATGAVEILAFCLADPGDAFLVPTPYYPAFDRDWGWRTGAKLYPVICDSSNDFKITRAALEAAYNKAQTENIRVKGVLLNNPSNPLGTVLDRDTLRDILRFINDKNIHIVCDEIYASTVFSQPEFVSIAEIIQEAGDNNNRNLVHIVYSLSKDMGFPGFRVGIVYSYNDAVVRCARKMSSFGLVSTQTQHLMAAMLSDERFVDRFIQESAERLGRRHGAFTRGLAQVGIGTLKSNAGLFLWMDLRRLLREPTFEAELELWRIIVHDVKLNVSPGCSFHCAEPGWFRVCFANMDDDTVRVALKRIRAFVLQRKGGHKQCRGRALQISTSFSRIMLDDFLMSPHSPASAKSPMVQATN